MRYAQKKLILMPNPTHLPTTQGLATTLIPGFNPIGQGCAQAGGPGQGAILASSDNLAPQANSEQSELIQSKPGLRCYDQPGLELFKLLRSRLLDGMPHTISELLCATSKYKELCEESLNLCKK